jgi:hypothetical protein
MPRLRVIFLAATPDDPNTYRAALWADVPASRQQFYTQPTTYVSAWSGATAADNTNLQNGSMVEIVILERVPPGTTITQVETNLQAAWTDYQNNITNYNPWAHYGSTWDGTTWNVVTVN